MLIFAGQSYATVLVHKNFKDLVYEADGILIGTVERIDYRETDGGRIFTFVTLGELKVINGELTEATLTLRMEGGESGWWIWYRRHVVTGSPQISLGDELLLFLRGNGTNVVPLVGWGQGMFRIVNEQDTGKAIVMDSVGNRVLGVADGNLIKEQRFPSEAAVVHLDQPGLMSELPKGGAGTSEGGETIQLDGPGADLPDKDAMTLESFIAAIEAGIKFINKQSRPIASVTKRDEIQAADNRVVAPEGVDSSQGEPVELLAPSMKGSPPERIPPQKTK